jgi:lantibiotic modifying enzyme
MVGLVVAALGVAIIGGRLVARGAVRGGGSTSTPSTAELGLIEAAGKQLLSAHVMVPGAGWAWPSLIQSPHLQTDRDVGTASVMIGLLALYSATNDSSYLAAARQAGNWLLAVAEPSDGGLRWPDWVDSTSSRSSAHFTSFDDGAPGIADALWRLGSITGDQRYTQAALAGMRWEEAQALSAGTGMLRWAWYDTGGVKSADYQTGIGEGQAGIIYAFVTFAQRTGDPQYLRYAQAGAAYLESLITPAGAIPEQAGSTGYDTGYLSGAAGDAFAFLNLYQSTHQQRWLNDAERLLSWLAATGQAEKTGIAWPTELDTTGQNQNDQLATGIEEGAAGIGWVELQAYKITGNASYLSTATSAGEWLLSVAKSQPSGVAWPEHSGDAPLSPSLDNGAAGIGWFLDDLWLATGQSNFEGGAQAARKWLTSQARHTTTGASWTGMDGTTNLPDEPSWHWGNAGIAAFLVRAAGWQLDIPGEEPATRMTSTSDHVVSRRIRTTVGSPRRRHARPGRRLLFGPLAQATLLLSHSDGSRWRVHQVRSRPAATNEGTTAATAPFPQTIGMPALRSLTMNTAIALPPSA